MSEGTGAAVVIEAPAGAGKSALLDLAERDAREAGWLVRRAAPGPGERQFASGVVRTLLEPPLPAVPHDLFAACAALAPVALLVDDAQWADPASLEALAHLARRVRDLPLLLVLAARPGDALAEPAAVRGVALLEPGPLSAAGSAELIRRAIPGATDAECDLAHRAAAGDPWLLGEIVRHGIDAIGGPPPALSRPGRIELRRRLGQLSAPAREVARALAIGTEPHHLSGDLAGVRDELAACGLCTGWRFVHGLIGRGVRNEMPPAERERLHRAAAAAGGSARHLLRCGPVGDPQAAAMLREAAAGATRRGAPHAAAAFLERALLERAPGDDRAAMLAQLADAAFHAGLPDPRRRLLQAIDERPDGRTRVEILTRLAALEVIDPHDATLLDGEDAPELRLARLDALLDHPDRHEERARGVAALDPDTLDDDALRAGALAHRAWLGAETGAPGRRRLRGAGARGDRRRRAAAARRRATRVPAQRARSHAHRPHHRSRAGHRPPARGRARLAVAAGRGRLARRRARAAERAARRRRA